MFWLVCPFVGVPEGELMLLVCGLRLVYKLRNASGDSHREKLVLGVSVALELVVSSAFYLARHALWAQLTPDQLLLLYFGRNQLTVSVSLALVFAPKVSRPPQSTSTPTEL